MNIILIGFMGSGKSTVAKCLSKLLGFETVEMDDLVYQKTNTSNMQEVFAKGGELLLRETEIEIAKACASKKNLILSTGGGVVLNKIILDYFKERDGKVIFLNVSFAQIMKQIEKENSRPLFKDEVSARKLYDLRLPLYVNYADEIIDIEFQSPEEIAIQIKEKINQKGSSHGL